MQKILIDNSPYFIKIQKNDNVFLIKYNFIEIDALKLVEKYFNKENLKSSCCYVENLTENEIIAGFGKNNIIEEGYIISQKDRVSIAIGSPSLRGLIYGIIDFTERGYHSICSKKNDIVKNEPKLKYRILCDMKDWALSAEDYVLKNLQNRTNIALFKWRPFMHLQSNEFRKVIEKDSGEPVDLPEEYNPQATVDFNKFSSTCHKFGLQTMIWFNEVLFPPSLVKKFLIHNPKFQHIPVHNPCLSSTICPSYPGYWKLYKSHLGEIFENLNNVDFFLFNTGDNAGDIFCNCQECRKKNKPELIDKFVRTTYEELKKHSPKTKIIIRMHNLGDWYWYNYGYDMRKIIEGLPKDLIWESKWNCPPGFDFSWNTRISPHLEGLDRELIITLAYDGIWQYNPSSAFFASAHRRLHNDLKLLLEKLQYKGVMFHNNNAIPAHDEAALGMLKKTIWDPYLVDPDKEVKNYIKNKVGEIAGEHYWDGIKNSEEIANRLLPVPYETSDTAHFKTFNQYKKIGPHYPYTPEGRELAPTRSLAGFLCNEEQVTPENINTLLEKIDALSLTETMVQNFRKALAANEDSQFLIESLGMSEQTDAYAHIVKAYFSAYFYSELAKHFEKQGDLESRKMCIDKTFYSLIQANSAKHLFTGKYYQIKLYMKTFPKIKIINAPQEVNYIKFSVIKSELDSLDWQEHTEYFIQQVSKGETIIFFADDLDHRHIEGEFFKKIMELEEQPGNTLIPRNNNSLFIVDENKTEPFSNKVWYQKAEIFVKFIGSGKVIYTHLEERPTLTLKEHFPYTGVERKENFKRLLSQWGLLENQNPDMNILKPVKQNMQWFGPFYNRKFEWDARYKLVTKDFVGKN